MPYRKRRELTAEQKAATEARRERFRTFVQAVKEMSEEQRTAIVERLGTVPTVEGHALSIFNTCLVLSQMENASLVGGFKQWRTQGRTVRKGEHGLMILAPKESKDPEEDITFYPATVFDISQTDEINTNGGTQ